MKERKGGREGGRRERKKEKRTLVGTQDALPFLSGAPPLKREIELDGFPASPFDSKDSAN